ncbi:polysaccharide biosynthesis protein [Clostridium sp. MB40-C1]|uniref:putative polysaccharide biosynthesis protein n=1 Tax=Clostridium sp. MB40-C1 TaxID=3070996 RepID=UPI0027DFA4FD|nr:polysaccharide biosynthesis protein [Clostridium sp. MB40-C1]WMJ80258.1 polysaccharide biosynthesis protein [Clostridium sp. MB40-C1]
MKKQSLLRGTFILGFAGIFSRALGMLFRIPLTILIGDEGIGYYQMAYPLYMLFIAGASGVPLAMSKMISEKNAKGDDVGVIQILKQALLLMVIFGITISLIMFTFSNVFIKLFRWHKNSYYSLIALATAPVFIAIMNVFRGFFQGLQNMTPTAISQILEQIARVIVGIGLAVMLLPKGIQYAAGGATLGAAAGGILGTLYLISRYKKIRFKMGISDVKYNHDIMEDLIRLAVPISIGACAGTIMNVIDTIIVPQNLLKAGYTAKESAILYGQLTGKAAVLVNVPLTLSAALCAVIVPIISEAYLLNDKHKLNRNILSSIKISLVVALPSLLGLYFLAWPILNLIFSGQVSGHEILKYSSLSIPFIILAQTTTVILQATTSKKLPVINLFIGCIVKIIVSNILIPIPNVNIYGAIAGTFCAYGTATVLNIRLLKKSLNIRMNLYESLIKPAYASMIMIVTVVFIYVKIYKYTLNNSISCLIAVLIGIIIYMILVLAFKVMNFKELIGKRGRK